ncbi:TetR/AcrR family transcriptional regulator [bacterium]|nr:TetR/AcrR family transcriptional regulator [bacterium]
MTTTRMPAEERREQITRAALRILGEGGRKSLTTASLAGEVSVTTGAIFRHFASMEDVLADAVRIAIEKVDRTFPDDGLEPLERIVALARNRVRVLGSDPGVAWLLRSEQASLELPAASVRDLRDLVRRSRTFVLVAIREGIAAGTVRDDVGEEQLLVVVMGTIQTLVGFAGVHGRARRFRPASAARMFDALRILLAPTAGNQEPGSRRASEGGSR